MSNKRERVCALCVLWVLLCVCRECAISWAVSVLCVCYECVPWVLLDGNQKHSICQTQTNTQREASNTLRTPHLPSKDIIYPLYVHSSKGIPPMQWQKADSERQKRGSMGVFFPRLYTYTPSHFYTKTIGDTQGNTNSTLWDTLEGSPMLYKGLGMRKDP